ncbi:MAG: Lpg1974 family pore-forming outer membrane protein [Candidatus Algichlamydia australiensis]|nr:Lpg1974 family pore-forming outer membrane protein [Chlamydiales bacterium]
MRRNFLIFLIFPLTFFADLQEQICELGAVNKHCDFGPNLRAARPCATWGFYASLEYLYWKTFQSGTEYAFSFAPPLLDGKSKEVAFDFDSGIRPGIGVTLPYDGWDLHLLYTYFRNSEKEDCQEASLFPLLAVPSIIQTTQVSRAKIDATLRFQTLDLEIGRATFLSKAFIARPFFGPRIGWIDQELDLTYFTGAGYKVEIENAFWGGGVRAGSELTTLLGKGFFLNGELALSALWGDLSITQKHRQDEVKVVDLTKEHTRMVPLVDLQAGIGWEIWFNEARNHFAITFDYEMQYIWNITQYARFPDNTTLNTVRVGKDIGIHGLTIKGRMDF